MNLKELTCINCSAPLTEDDLVLDMQVARCGHCNAVFGLENMPQGSAPIERPPVPVPKGFETLERGGQLEIRHRWFTPTFFFLVFFCIFWNGFMIVWHVISLSTGAWFMSVFGLLHTAVGIGLAYYTVAGFVNTTYVTVRNGLLQIRHRPLPWRGQKDLRTADIDQLYTREKVNRGNNGTNYSYQVVAVRGRGDGVKVVSGLEEIEQALYLEQQIEKFLGIEDRPVGGEVPR